MLSALWLDYLTCPGCETASEHYETWLVISSLFLLPCLPRVTVKADEKETTWTRSPPNKGERGHWIQTQVVFWCQQNLCQWGETRWMLGRGRSRASRKAGERRAPPQILRCPSRSAELVYLTTGLGEQEGLLKIIGFVVLPPFQRWFKPPLRLHPECQLLKTIAVLYHIDQSWGLLCMTFFWC